MYEGVHAGMVYSNRFDESSDPSTTCLGRTNMTRETKVKADEKFPISGHGFTMRKLLDDTDCQMSVRYRCKQMPYAKVILLEVQNIYMHA